MHAAVSAGPRGVTRACSLIIAHPMRGADASVRARWAGGYVEGSDGQALSVKAHHGGSTGGAVIHIAQVSVIIHQHMATAAVYQAALMVESGWGDVSSYAAHAGAPPNVGA